MTTSAAMIVHSRLVKVPAMLFNDLIRWNLRLRRGETQVSFDEGTCYKLREVTSYKIELWMVDLISGFREFCINSFINSLHLCEKFIMYRWRLKITYNNTLNFGIFYLTFIHLLFFELNLLGTFDVWDTSCTCLP